jgi:hypothetical protein
VLLQCLVTVIYGQIYLVKSYIKNKISLSKLKDCLVSLKTVVGWGERGGREEGMERKGRGRERGEGREGKGQGRKRTKELNRKDRQRRGMYKKIELLKEGKVPANVTFNFPADCT